MYMAKLPEDVVSHIRASNDIVEVIGEYVSLTKRGRNHFGLCPFHEEKTPSFSVNQEKQMFHCFGCGKGGNVITFVMEIEQISYIEAVEFLAKRIHYPLEQIETKQPSYSKETLQLFSAYDWLVKYYHHLLRFSEQGEAALTYLKNRGINEETIERFQLGYAPLNSKLTVTFLQQKDFSLPFLVKNRILNMTENDTYLDPFRGRVIFPIQNRFGKTVAFGGRAIHDEEPKYLNSPEHTLFQKGNILYNFHNAKRHIQTKNEAIVFEGYLDVLAADQANIKNVVATLGTTLTEEHAKVLKRSADKVILCFDGDESGLNASYEAAQLLQNFGLQVKIAHLENDLDPDEYIKRYGGEAFREAVLDRSDTFFKFFMRYALRKYDLNIDSDRIEYIEELTRELAKIDAPIEREMYAAEIAERFNLSEQTILHDVYKLREKIHQEKKDKLARKSNTNISTNFPKHKREPAYVKAEKALLAHMMEYPFIIEKVQEEIGMQFNVTEHQVIVAHLYALYEEKNRIDISELVDKVDEDKIRSIITEISLIDTNESLNEEEINDYIRLIKLEATHKAQLRLLKQKLKLEKNPLLAAEIGMQIIELQKKMKSL